jgi:hypothetical protein
VIRYHNPPIKHYVDSNDNNNNNNNETNDILHCLQLAIAGLRAQVEDFRAEQEEDISAITWQLQELRKNKVWIERGRV